MSQRSVRGYVSGRVQGVGFRYFVRRHATAEGVAGFAHNLPDGRVEFLLQGEADAVARVLAAIHRGPSYARVSAVDTEEADDLPKMEHFRTG